MTIPPDWFDVALLGDCLEWLPKVPTGIATLAVFDPPYGLNFISNHPKKGNEKIAIQADATLDEALDLLVSIIEELKRIVIKGGQFYIFFGGGGRLPLEEKARLRIETVKDICIDNVLIWNKKAPGSGWRYRFSYETIFHIINNPLVGNSVEIAIWRGGCNQMNVLDCNRIIPNVNEHPTKKPVMLLSRLIRNSSNPGDVVIDPTAGEFTTCQAAKSCGRRYIGMEIEEKWWRLGVAELDKIKEQLSFDSMECGKPTGQDYMEAGRERAKHTLFNLGSVENSDDSGDRESVPSEGEAVSPGLPEDGVREETSNRDDGKAQSSEGYSV